MTSDDSSMGLLKLRALLRELGHPPRGPGGGKAPDVTTFNGCDRGNRQF